MLINTGDLVKRLRAGSTAGRREPPGAGGLRCGRHHPGHGRGSTWPGAAARAAGAATRAARAVLGADRVPRWQRDLPRGGTPRRPHPADDPDAVFVPSCLGTLFAPAQGGTGVAAALLTLAERGRRTPARAGRHRRPVLRHPVVVEGTHRRLPGGARPRCRRCCAPRAATARCRWSATRPAPRASNGCSTAPGTSGSSTRSRTPPARCCPG
ncbi:hypothetical protein V2I01_36475 [Micromonospora sp. BRA006-A]|nr:hypothetical protein [Micromonospora sp. BRA006-A]